MDLIGKKSIVFRGIMNFNITKVKIIDIIPILDKSDLK